MDDITIDNKLKNMLKSITFLLLLNKATPLQSRMRSEWTLENLRRN